MDTEDGVHLKPRTWSGQHVLRTQAHELLKCRREAIKSKIGRPPPGINELFWASGVVSAKTSELWKDRGTGINGQNKPRSKQLTVVTRIRLDKHLGLVVADGWNGWNTQTLEYSLPLVPATFFFFRPGFSGFSPIVALRFKGGGPIETPSSLNIL